MGAIIALWTLLLPLCQCQFPMERDIFPYMSSNEEMHHYIPPEEQHYRSEGFHPEPVPHKNLYSHFPMSQSFYQPLPMARLLSDSSDLNQKPEVEPNFQPQAQAGTADNPLTRMIDPMRKQMSDSMKEMEKQAEDVGKQFGETGQKVAEAMQKPAEEMGKQAKGTMENAQKEFDEHVDNMKETVEEARTGLPFIPTSASKTTTDDSKKKKLGDTTEKKKEDHEEITDAKKSLEGSSTSASKKMQETSSKIKKNFPIPGRLISGIKDETTEVHEDDEEYPRAEAMEWAPSDFVQVRYHPRSRFFDYYYDGDY